MGDKVRVQELDTASHELLRSHCKDWQFARFGDMGYIMPLSYKRDVDEIKNMAVRPDDLWIVSFPRSGTTWTQELVWLLLNDLDYDTAAKIQLLDRYLFLEVKHVTLRVNPNLDPTLVEKISKIPPFEAVVNAPSPRYIKTHTPFSLLPPRLLDTTKVVYVARDPRDVAVSFYYHSRIIMNYDGDFKSYWNLFINDLVIHCPFFPHLKQAWALRHHPNMFFLFYEDMSKDLPSCVKRIADFLGKEVTNEQVAKLSEHLNINNFRKNASVNPSLFAKVKRENHGFIRKGVVGGWREYFDEEMAAQAQQWLRENLAGTDLRFPHDLS